MRIDEITRPKTINDAHKILSMMGYEEIGYGSFSSVFQKAEDDHVLKLFSSTDWAYRKFVEFCLSNPEDLHLPRFRRKPFKISGSYYGVILEELIPSTERFGMEKMMLVSSILDGMATAARFKKSLNSYINKNIQELTDIVGSQSTSLLITASKIGSLMNGNQNSFCFDFKPSNIMNRSGTLVIIDPMASSS